jgi:hypothetical protein
MAGPLGFVTLLILLALAKFARHFKIGPQWLRRFVIEKHTLF